MEKQCMCGYKGCNRLAGWNYRIVDDGTILHPDSPSFGIYEVYYNKRKIHGWSERPMDARGDSPVELLNDLSLMSSAYSAPVLRLIMFRGKQKMIEVDVNRITGRTKKVK